VTHGPQVVLDRVTVRAGDRVAVAGVSGTFPAGSLTAVCGPNGAGKTSLLTAIAGVLAPAAGRIRCEPAARVAYLPQVPFADPAFPVRVHDVALMGAWGRPGRTRAGDHARAAAALAAVGLHGYAERLLCELSAGERQRAAIARLVMEDAPLVLLDEPLTALDDAGASLVLRLVADWHAEGRTVIAVMHDAARVRAAFPRTLLLAGRVVAWGDTVPWPATRSGGHATARPA